MKNGDYFIENFLQLDYGDSKALYSLIGNIEAHLAAHGSDTKLELALHAAKARKEDETNSGFDKVCEAAKFAVDKLKDQEDWDIVEFDIFCGVLGRIRDYKLTTAMMEKCFDMLERNFKDVRHYEYRKARIFFEMTNRFMRAKFFDNVDPQELTKLFDTCVKSAIKMLEDLELVALRTAALVRQAIFNENPAKILECIKAMEATKNKYWIKASKDEVVEYVRFIGDNVTTKLHNFVVGWQIKKRRKELGISTLDFADMIGSTQTAVNEFERGDKGVGSERFYKIIKVLQVQNISYLFGEPLVNASVVAKDTYEYQMVQLTSGMSEKRKKLALTLVKELANDDDE